MREATASTSSSRNPARSLGSDVLAGIVDRSLGRGGHIADRQFLGHDQTMLANQLGRYLVDVVLAPIGHLPVALGERPTRLGHDSIAGLVARGTTDAAQSAAPPVHRSAVYRRRRRCALRGHDEGLKRLNTPIEPRFKVSTFPMRPARDDERHEPPVGFARAPNIGKKCIHAAMLARVRETAATRCTGSDGILLGFNGEADHVHLLVALPPNLDLSRFVNNLKTTSSRPRS